MRDLPYGWSSVPLGDAATWFSGGTPRTSEPKYWNGEIPWISAASLNRFYITDSDRRVTALGAANGTRLVDPGAVIFVVRGMSLKTEFRIGIARRGVAFGQDCKALIARPGIQPEFLAYSLQARTPEVLDMVDEAGHGTGRLQTDRLQALPIFVPPSPEQHAIVEVLGALDDKIESNERIATDSERLTVTLLASLGPSVRLSEIAESERRQMAVSEFSNRLVDHYSLPAFDSGVRPERCSGGAIKSGKFLITSPVVLVSKLNPYIPRVWRAIPNRDVMSLASTEFVVLHPRSGVTSEELWAACASEQFNIGLMEHVTGTTGSHQRVRPGDMMQLSVTDPRGVPQEEREVVRGLVARAEAARQENVRLTALRNVLVPGLVFGERQIRAAEMLVEESV